jgi:hypothetical protein
MAKKKSKEDLKKEAETVKGIFATAKKKPQNCAMALCGDGSVAIEADPRLPIDSLLKKVRKADGATPKWVKGRLSVKGSAIQFDLAEEMPGGFDTKFKQYLTKLGVKMKPNFSLPDVVDGEKKADDSKAEQAKKERARPSLKQDDAETPQKVKPAGFDPVAKEAVTAKAKSETQTGATLEEEEEQPQPATEPELSKEQLTKDIKHITEVFKLSFEGMDETQSKEIKGALQAVAASIKSGDLAGAQGSINKIGLLTGVTPQSPLRPISLGTKEADKEDSEPLKQKKELIKEFADLKPEIQRSMEIANPEHKAELQKLAKDFGKQMKVDDMDASKKTFEAFKIQIAAFHKKRSEGVKARKAKFDVIKSRVEEITKRLNELDTGRRAA